MASYVIDDEWVEKANSWARDGVRSLHYVFFEACVEISEHNRLLPEWVGPPDELEVVRNEHNSEYIDTIYKLRILRLPVRERAPLPPR